MKQELLKGINDNFSGVLAGRVLAPKLADNLTRTVLAEINLPVI